MNTKTIIKLIVVVVGVVTYGYKYFTKNIKMQTPNQRQEVFTTTESTKTRQEVVSSTDFYFPSSTTGQVIHHNNYSLSYAEQHEQPEWVAYVLDKSHLSTAHRKRPFFYEDPKVKTKSADWKNYKKSGYDKGHLCPAADRKHSVFAYNETFLTSNISPQVHAFNSGIWNRLEQQTRIWAAKYGRVYVITAGVLQQNLPTIGREQVSVPKAFYRIIAYKKQGEYKAIAFLLPHKASKAPLSDYLVSIDALEQQTGIDFFKTLPDTTQASLESGIASKKDWYFKY